MIRTLCFVVALLLAAPGAGAAPYWVSYEGNDYPENEGWTRYTLYGGAQRSFEDGSLVLDSHASPGICDFYKMLRPGTTDPAPGETFVMEWRLKIEQLTGPYELDTGVFADSKWAVGFQIGDRTIQSAFEPGVSASFTPGVFHAFRFVSGDMRSYTLSIDGQQVIKGLFWESLNSSEVGFGDGVQGPTSLSYWDYFRYGVVPEPTSIGLVFMLVGSLRGRTSRS